MTRFFLKFVLILFLVLIFDQGIGAILKHFYFHQKYGAQSQITYVIDSTVADIIIFGSSRANHHYIPEIFEKRLKNTCFNAGMDGNYFLYSYALFKTIVQRYSPKLVIFDIRPYELGYITNEYERLSLLLPYYQTYPEIRHVIDLRGPFEKYKHISAIYSFNSLIFQTVRGNLKFGKTSEPVLNGYIPLYRTMKHEKIGTWDVCNIIFDENKIHALNDIISTCKQKNIELVFVHSPIWITIQYNSCKNKLSDMCFEQGIQFIDMANDSTFINNPNYFDDISHLNNEGAKIFSNMLINKLHIN